MIRIDIDQEAFEEVRHSVNKMLQNLEHLRTVDLGTELSEWQTEDMGRNRPFTMRFRRAGKVQTVIRPHSLIEVTRSVRYQQRMGRRISRLLGKPSKRAARTVKAVFHSFEPKTSMRPYLRQQMLTRLSERLIEMAAEKLKW